MPARQSSAQIAPLSLDDPRVLRPVPWQLEAPAPPPGVTTLPALFQHRASLHPADVAFSCQSPGQGLHKVTYGEAHRIALAVATKLRDATAGRDPQGRAPTIAIWLEKGLELNLGILAATYSGATWLPFDPDVPAERAATCCQDASASVLLTDSQHLDRAQQVAALASESSTSKTLRVVTFSDLLQSCRHDPVSESRFQSVRFEAQPRDAAYLIYTSGTTGTPKGISIPHEAALTFSLSEQSILETSREDIVWNGTCSHTAHIQRHHRLTSD